VYQLYPSDVQQQQWQTLQGTDEFEEQYRRMEIDEEKVSGTFASLLIPADGRAISRNLKLH